MSMGNNTYDANLNTVPFSTGFKVSKELSAVRRNHTSTKVWMDARGKKWPIKEMASGHLCNSIRLLARKFYELQCSTEFVGYDEGFAARGPSAIFPVYKALFKEALRRGLIP